MSEFVHFPENEMRPLSEVLADAYATVREKLGSFVSSITMSAEYNDGVAYAEQQSGSSQQSGSGEQSPPAHGPGSSCTATACSACGTGTSQWTTRPGLRS